MTDLLPSAGAPTPDADHASSGHDRTKGGQRTRLVVDTSVLIADPTCVLEFADADVVIPLTVVEELDGLKSRPDDVGRAARTALRTLEELRVRARRLAGRPGSHRQRHRHAADRDQRHPQAPAHRARARPGGARQPHHRRRPRPVRLRPDHDDLQRRRAAHQGGAPRRRRRRAPPHAGRIVRARAVGWIDARGALRGRSTACTPPAPSPSMRSPPTPPIEFTENEFAVLRSGSQSALVRAVDDEFVLLPQHTPEAWGLRPRSKEQRFALELLLDPDVTVVALDGRAGTGKTILAIAAGLEQVVEQRTVRTPRRLPAARARSAAPTSASCPADSTRSSTRGWRRSTMPSSRSPTAAAARTHATWSTS